MAITIIQGATIHTPQEALHQHKLVIESGRIKDITNSTVNIANAQVLKLSSQHQVIPGIIDLFVHGAQGADVMDATPQALATIAQALPQEGVTAFLAATMTQTYDNIERALANIKSCMTTTQTSQAQLLGAYLEGPFLCLEKTGAQAGTHIVAPDLTAFKRWQALSGGHIKLVAIAPEQAGALDFIAYLKQQQVIASIAHSNATYQQAVIGIEAGCRHVTHLFNAMSGIHHKKPGAALAALLDDRVMVEIIADGIHLPDEIMKLVLKTKPRDKILLVSDSIRAKYLSAGNYELGGQSVIVHGNRVQLSDGTLAGSVLKMNHAIKNIMDSTGCSFADAIAFSCENPAKQLGIFDRKGSIECGKDADLAIFKENMEVAYTFRNGEIIYQQ